MRDRSELVAFIHCPRCQRNSGRMEVEAFRAFCRCTRLNCEQRWWVMWLNPGEVRPQLAEALGDELAAENMVTFNLPERLTEGIYWQLSISDRMYEENASGGSKSILSALLALFRSRGPIDGRNN